ncbi:angiopoietin 8 [Labeo rohita]|uniref:Angiopoietin 8 n=1 Tax=Labeo rohita TaxID=84645 RepID=A0A498MS96_LABRO|nr:angiopoietin 8 [Labeo rohita]
MNRVSSSPLKSVGEKLASVDDVNILMYGVLQFTESLHHMYQTTEARLARVTKAISRTESEMKRLGHDTEEVAKTEQQIKEKLQLIQMKALEIQVHENRDTVTRVELEEAQLKKKLTSLEENLMSSVPDTIKGTPLKHISNLKDLMKWTQEQKLKLENQNQQLADLQKQNMV